MGVGSAAGQGVQTGVLTGTATSSDGLSLPGATVAIKSPALQGVRTTVTDINGVYFFRGLPPGDYTLTFTMDGMAEAERAVTVPLGGVATVDLVMSVAPVQETVLVTAPLPSVLATAHGGANYRHPEINALPSGRTPFLIAELAPGLTNNTPNANQATISGAFAYDKRRLPQQRRAQAPVPGAAAPVELPPAEQLAGERPLDRSARERRHLRGRRPEHAGDLVADRRLSRDHRARPEQSRRPRERFPAAQGARVERLHPASRLIGQSEEEGFVCAWCENAIEDEESVTTVSLSLQNRQLVEEYAGGPMPFPVASEGRIVTAYVSGAESEAQGEGSDVFFALCSGECAKALRDALKRSEGMVQS